jgi:hypothetical protein
MQIVIGFLAAFAILFGMYILIRVIAGLLTFQIDEEWKCDPEREGWSFSLLPRRVGNKTIFWRYYYYKKWVDRGYDGDRYYAYVVYYLDNPNTKEEDL